MTKHGRAQFVPCACGETAFAEFETCKVSIADMADQSIWGRSWFRLERGGRGLFYARKCSDGHSHLHRCIVTAATGFVVDHINGDSLDNRRANLRITTHAENMRNRRRQRNNKSGVPGVHYCNPKRKWRAAIKVNGKIKFLGAFREFADAVAARKNAEAIVGSVYRHTPGALTECASSDTSSGVAK